MFPPDQFNRGYQPDRIPRFASSDRQMDGRSRREFPMRSQSTRIDMGSPRDVMMQRKSSLYPPMSKFDLSQRESDIEMIILPTDVTIEDDDPLKEIIQMQNSISEKFVNTLESSCKVISAATEIINECPKFSKAYKNAQQVGADLEMRVKYITAIEDGTDANLEDVLN